MRQIKTLVLGIVIGAALATIGFTIFGKDVGKATEKIGEGVQKVGKTIEKQGEELK